MKQNLEELLEKIKEHEAKFYSEVLPLHENQLLRKLAGAEGEFEITKCEEDKNYLTFTEGGLTVEISYCNASGDFGWRYHHLAYDFEVESNKLVTTYEHTLLKNKKEKKELLELFPDITAEQIKEALEQEIVKRKLYKTAMGEG